MHSHNIFSNLRVYAGKVLILVVMEDALAQTFEFDEDDCDIRLNPCCNGRCTRTYKTKS